jgi:hypothetical protein
MTDTEAVEAKPQPTYHLDRPSARTDAEREAAFQRFLELSASYNAAIVAAGDETWHGGDIEKRRERYMRRYAKPKAPQL